MRDKYILKDKESVPCEDLIEWAKWYETKERFLWKTKLKDVHVSTVFLGLDHNVIGAGAPILFESMVFENKISEGELPGGKKFDYHESLEEERYRTYAEAEDGHKKLVQKYEEKEGKNESNTSAH